MLEMRVTRVVGVGAQLVDSAELTDSEGTALGADHTGTDGCEALAEGRAEDTSIEEDTGEGPGAPITGAELEGAGMDVGSHPAGRDVVGAGSGDQTGAEEGSSGSGAQMGGAAAAVEVEVEMVVVDAGSGRGTEGVVEGVGSG